MESSFQIASCECPDINASTLAVDANGQHAVISSRKSLVLFDLDGNKQENNSDDGFSESASAKQTSTNSSAIRSAGVTTISQKSPVIAKRMIRNAKYEPTASHFNRLMSDLFALTTCQVVDIFSIEDLSSNRPKLSLKGHSRAITDVEWSHFDPYLLGSSAADCMTNLWDIRDNRRPASTLTSVSGSTLVRFSKASSNLLATSHEIDVRIWDIRQPNLPLNYIAAHLQKINGMDWNPSKASCGQEQLITCSQDNTIKLWDLSASKVKPSANLQTRTPAWRVRYTPVSPNAIMTSLLPQLRSRSECSTLKLWSMKPDRYEQKKLEMILSLAGHNDVIVDFDWRARPSSNCCEIVSWSKDQTLRVWRVDNQFIEMNVDNSDYETGCGIADNTCESLENSSLLNETFQSGDQTKSSPRSKPNTPSSLAETDTGLKSLKIRDESFEESDPDDLYPDTPSAANELKQEFNLINKNIPNVQFEELNSLRRVCVVTAHARISCRLRIALPPSYPQSDCPTFTIIDSDQIGGESLSNENKERLLNILDETAKMQLTRSRNCIEPCLRRFIAALQKMTNNGSNRSRTSGSGAEYKDDPITLSAQRDHSVPFPQTSGAKFCGNLLVCFGRPMIPTINMSSSGGDSTNYLVETPRSMAQLSAQLDNMRRQGSYNLSYISISYFYYGIMRRAELANRGKNLTSNGRAGSKYLPNRGKTSQSIMSKNFKCGPVLIYDVSSLLGGLSKDLAESYVFYRDVIKMCRKNAEIAASYNRKDLIQIWSLAELSSEGVISSYETDKDNDQGLSLTKFDSDFGDRPWTMHPFGSKLIQSLIDHYVHNCHDVQTAAMLVWTFSSPKVGKSTNPQNTKLTSSAAKSNNSPLYNMMTNYHTVIPGMLNASNKNTNIITNNVDTISGEWSFVNGPETHLYSNSWSNSTIHENLAHESQQSGESKLTRSSDMQVSNGGNEDRLPRLNILSPERSLQNDLIMHIYAELLYRLNLLNQRAMVLKNIGSNSAYSSIFGDKQNSIESPEDRLPNLTIQCSNINCRNKCYSPQCPSCQSYSLCCSICRLPVKGSCSTCLKCLHGGHVNHFKTWFSSYDFCPTGCGCKCLSTDD